MSRAGTDFLGYRRLNPPVEIVTPERGREVYADAADLLERLDVLAAGETPVLQITQSAQHADSDAVGALNALLRQPGGLHLFRRAARAAGVPYSAKNTRWQVEFLFKYLGFTWHRSAA